MECGYRYKGRFFANEIALDDFLIETRDLPEDITDLVLSNELTVGLGKTTKAIWSLIDKARQEKTVAASKEAIIYDENGEVISSSGGTVSVTSFIHMMVGETGGRVSPEFIEDNYFEKRYDFWRKGEYNDDEKLVLGARIEGHKATEEECKKFREQIKNKWAWLGSVGTALHEVVRVCFSKEKDADRYNFLRSTDPGETANYLYNYKLRDWVKERVSLEDVKNLVIYANNIHNLVSRDTGSKNVLYFAEVTITEDTISTNPDTPNNTIKLKGRVDLIAIDDTGLVHIIDFKSSPKPYSEYSNAKKITFLYQIALYNRMLSKNGVNAAGGNLYIAPITLKNVHRESSDKGYGYVYDGIECANLMQRIDTDWSHVQHLWDNIDKYLPWQRTLSLTTQLAGEAVSLFMLAAGLVIEDERTEEEIWAKRLKKMGAFVPDENGRYVWRMTAKKIIEAASEEELLRKTIEEVHKLPDRTKSLVKLVKEGIRKSLVEGPAKGHFPIDPIIRTDNSTPDYLYQMIKPYCNGGWEIVLDEMLEEYGIIVLHTKTGVEPSLVDIIRVSTSNLKTNQRDFLAKDNPLRGRKSLLGKFVPDIEYLADSHALMLEATNGNIELIETMALLNQTEGFEGSIIGNIKVINPVHGKGMTASNEELAYCWKELTRRIGNTLTLDRFKSGEIKFASCLEKYRQELRTILFEAQLVGYTKDYGWVDEAAFKSCILDLDKCINNEFDINLKIAAVNEIREKIQKLYKSKNRSLNESNTFDLIDQNQAARLEAEALYAIALLRGINFKLELRDHDNWCDDWNVFFHGWSGLNVDNPGLQAGETINLISKMLLQSYQNLRSDMLRRKRVIDQKLAKFKKAKGMSYMKEFVANQASIYSNLYEFRDGDFLFKRLDQVVGEEREFLEFVLDTINKDRFPNLSPEELQRKKERGDLDYYRVPIVVGSFDSKVEVEGLLNLAKSKLRFLDPRYAAKTIEREVKDLITTTSRADEKNSEVMFEASNGFSLGETEDYRLQIISKIGIQNIEHNLEALLYKHAFAYSSKNHIDEVFPMIKAAYIHLSDLGFMQNTKFNNELLYIRNFINSKIFLKPLDDPRMGKFRDILYKGRSVASVMTLAFSPVLRMYQELMSLWVNISLAIRQPDKLTEDGKTAFTFANFKKVLPMVYRDAFHYSDVPSMWEGINMTYGLNDMDMTFFGDLINNSKKGLFNFLRFALINTTRPDFYHRCTIFGCKMEADGCLDAHSVDENGTLIYDWTKDKRFDAFAAGRTSDPRYNAQLALYYAMAKEFVEEHALMPDGSEFKLNMRKPMALPRAYTTKLAESIKSLSDNIYGFYSSEKKSLIHNMWMGALWFQFRTYWSAKKNQYLQAGGVRLQGEFTLLIIDGQRQYYVIKDGEITEEMTTEDTGVPVMKWTGQWQEGVIVTMSNLLKEAIGSRSFIGAFNHYWNNDNENLRYAYRNNMKKFMYDICLWMLGGNILCGALEDELKEMVKDNKQDHDIMEGMQVAAFNVLVRSLKTSYLDINFAHSVVDPLVEWEPFMFTWWSREAKNVWNIAMGDKSFYDGLLSASSALSQIRPVFDSLDLSE